MVPNGSKWFQMVPSGSKWFQMFPNGSKWFQMVQNGFKIFKFSKWFQMVPNEHHDTHLRPCYEKLSPRKERGAKQLDRMLNNKM